MQLGLSTPEKTRQKVISAYKKEMNQVSNLIFNMILIPLRTK
jgi:hypothetical protein